MPRERKPSDSPSVGIIEAPGALVGEFLRYNGVHWDNSSRFRETDDGLEIEGKLKVLGGIETTGGIVAVSVVGPHKHVKADITDFAHQHPFTEITGIAARAQLPAAIAYEDEANTFTLTQTIAFGGLRINFSDSGGHSAIEFGRTDGIASTPFFDFHSGATAVDYDSRIIASGGTGVTGGGTLKLEAAAVQFTGAVGIGVAAPTASELDVRKTWSAATAGEQFGLFLSIDYAIADTGLKQGHRANTAATHATGVLDNLIGVLSLVQNTGAGTTTNAAGVWVRIDKSAGTITSATTFRAVAPAGAGTITTLYGLYVEAMTAGATNFAIFTNSGLVRFGDNLRFGGVSAEIIAADGVGTTPGRIRFNQGSPVAIEAVLADSSAYAPFRASQLYLANAASKIIPGATSLSLRNNADTADNLLLTDAGLATFRNTVRLSGDFVGASSTSVAQLGAREWQFRLDVGDEANAGKITYRQFDTTALNIVGAGTGSNRLVRVWDHLAVGVAPSTLYSLNLASDLKIGSLGVFDSGDTPTEGQLLIYKAGATNKWQAESLNAIWGDTDFKAAILVDGAATYIFFDPGTGADSPVGAPADPSTPILTQQHGTHTVEVRDYARPADFRWFEWQYDKNSAGAWIALANTTSPKVVHSRLPFDGTTFRYRVRVVDRAGNASLFATTAALTPIRTGETHAFGAVIAGEIAVANLAAITATMGILTSGQIRGPGNTAGINFSGAGGIPGTWTTGVNFENTTVTGMARYLNFNSTAHNNLFKTERLTIGHDGTVQMYSTGAQPLFDLSSTDFRLQENAVTPVRGVNIMGTVPGGWTTYVNVNGSGSFLKHDRLQADFDGTVLMYQTSAQPMFKLNATDFLLQEDAAIPARGILIDGTLPGAWNRYLNLNGTGAFLKHERLEFNYDGSVKMYGSSGRTLFNLTATDYYLQQDAVTPLGGVLVMGTLPGSWTRYLNVAGSGTFLKHERGEWNYDGSVKMYQTSSQPLFKLDATDFLLQNDAASPVHGILLDGTRPASWKRYLDLVDGVLAIKDDQATPVLRVVAGKAGAGAMDYGLQVFDQNAATVMDFTGAKRILAVPVQDQGIRTANFTINFTTGWTQRVQLGASGLVVTFSNPTNGQRERVWWQQDTTGSRTLPTHDEIVMWESDTPPVLSTEPGVFDVIEYEYSTIPTSRYLGRKIATNVKLPAPIRVNETTTSFGTAATSHLVSVGSGIVSGMLLLMAFASANAPTVTTPGGWTLLASTDANGPSRLRIYGKIADGTENGTTVDVVTSTEQKAAADVFQIKKWFGNLGTNGIQKVDGTIAGSGQPDSASLTPTWATDRVLWFTFCSMINGQAATAPTNYSGGGVVGGTGTDSVLLGVGFRTLYAAVENPGAFSATAGNAWGAATLAVRPPA